MHRIERHGRWPALISFLAVSACGPEVFIGTERRLTITTSVGLADGRRLEAGFRFGSAPTEATSDLWYGRTAADGSLEAFETLDVAQGADAIHTSVMFGSLWVLAGSVTEASGRRVAWVRAVNERLEPQWTALLPAPVGDQHSEAFALASTIDDTVLVGGTETQPDGSVDGYVLQLTRSGELLWRRSFATDFTRQAKGTRVRAIGVFPAPASSSRRAFFVAGDRDAQGATGAEALQMTLEGELWDSGALGTPGIGRAVFLDRELPNSTWELSFCAELNGAPAMVHRTGFNLDEVASTRATVDGQAQVAGCAATPADVFITGTLTRGASQIPYLAAFDRAAKRFRGVTELADQTGVTVYGVTVDSSGEPVLLGRQNGLLRRWSARVQPAFE